MMLRIALLVVLPFILQGTAASAEDATDRLLESLSGMQQLTGRFRQRQYGEDGQLATESLGRFRLLRPGYFSWEIDSPGSQLVIADPEGVWHYDRDLETASRRAANSGDGMSPLQVLGGDETALREGYRITMEEDEIFTLVPTGGNPGFRQLKIRLRAYLIENMEITDNLNQRVEIDFGELQVDAGLTPKDFAFQPPDGVDVFYYDR